MLMINSRAYNRPHFSLCHHCFPIVGPKAIQSILFQFVILDMRGATLIVQ